MARPLIEAEAEMEPPETEAGTGCEAPDVGVETGTWFKG